MRSAEEPLILCEALDRLLNKGVVLVGDVTISLADVDLIWIGLRLIVTSVETARRSFLKIDHSDTLKQGVPCEFAGIKKRRR
ncbi:MAG TPA: gas vesicle protein [Candidatus Hypogeohydataceae bacterium YC41]